MLIEATDGSGSSSITMASFSLGGFTMTLPREIHCDFLFFKELHYNSLFCKELQCDFLVNLVLDNILKTPARISIMIPGVVILAIDFFIFVRELVILRKSVELLVHNILPSLCHIGCILGSCIKGL